MNTENLRRIFDLKNLLLQLVCIIFCTTSYTANAGYGDSCTALPYIVDTKFLETKSIYHYVKQMVDVTAKIPSLEDLNLNPDLCTHIYDQKLTYQIKIDQDKGDFFMVTNQFAERWTLGSSSKLIENASDVRQSAALSNAIFSTKLIGDKFCVTTLTSRGYVPIGCRKFSKTLETKSKDLSLNFCTPISSACYQSSKSNGSTSSHSRFPFNFSGSTYQCLSESLHNIFFKPNFCDDFIPSYLETDSSSFNPFAHEDTMSTLAKEYSDANQLAAYKANSVLNPFSKMQLIFKRSIYAALLIYTILTGFKVAIGEMPINMKTSSMFVMKMLFVIYFTVGIDTNVDKLTLGYWFSPEVHVDIGTNYRLNGVEEYLLPLLLQASNGFSNIIFNSGSQNGLCKFDISQYEPGYKYYALWDSIDCRIGYYLGLIKIPTPGGGTSQNNIYNFFGVMLGLLLGGNIFAVLFSLIFVIFFIGMLIQFITAYLVCLLTLYVMVYLAPIFVPLILFEKTQGYFNAWIKIMVSCALQPAIMLSFIAFMLTMFDSALYGKCTFTPDNANEKYTTFKIIDTSDKGFTEFWYNNLSAPLPYSATKIASSAESTYSSLENIASENYSSVDTSTPFKALTSGRTATIGSVVDIITQLSSAVPECAQSPGYELLKMYNGNGWSNIHVLLIRIYYIGFDESFITNQLFLLIFCFIFYFFAQSIAAFAAGITGGPNLTSVTSSMFDITAMIQKHLKDKADKDEEKNRTRPKK